MPPQILLVEDNEANRYLARYLLENAGYQVRICINASEAFLALDQFRPDLILLDIQLPDMDGYEIARRLKARPELARVPLVAVTSFAMVGDREKAVQCGFKCYIEKPINHQTFVTQISNCLQEAKPHEGTNR